MNPFEFYNPVRIVFGKGRISELDRLVPENMPVMLLYGGGSIKANGVFDQVSAALKNRSVVEFSGIEPNPEYETCLAAAALAKEKNVGFILAVGGGSVLDAAKFIAAAICYLGEDPWEILSGKGTITDAIPIGCVLTLPATGSEMNSGSVISRRATTEKRPFAHPKVFPVFSILDPTTTYSLPKRQVVNGVVDAYVHVTEQYLTYDVNAPLQDRQAEAILLTLMEEGPKALEDPENYDVRANIMWCATSALNGVISCGVPQDWATHMIGHELTAHFGMDHGQSLAIVLPAMMVHQRTNKKDKLVKYAERVFGITGKTPDETTDLAIAETISFFRRMGMKTRLSEMGISLPDALAIGDKITARKFRYGERQNIDGNAVKEILMLAE